MSLNIDALIKTGAVEIQRRIKRYDVQWGRPFNALYYKRLALSYVPAYYWKIESGTSSNIGFLRSTYDLTPHGSGITYTAGVVDPTDNMAVMTGAGYLSAAAGRAETEASNGYTASGWFYVDTSTVSADKIVLSKAPNRTGATATITLGIQNTSGTIYPFAQFANGVKLAPTDPSYQVRNLAYNQILVSVEHLNSTWTASLYINGELAASASGSGYAPSTSDTSTILVGAARNGSGVDAATYFNGNIDEVFLTFRPLTAQSVADLYTVGISATYIEPDERFDTDVLATSTNPKTWDKLIRSLSPLHWWRLESTAHVGSDWITYDTPIANPASGSDLKCHGSTANATTYTGLITTKNGASSCKKFSRDSNYAESTDSLHWTATAGSLIDFTASYWFKSGSNSEEGDGILGFNGEGYWGSSSGFACYVRNHDMYVIFYGAATSIDPGTPYVANTISTVGTTFRIEEDQTYHVACTISTNGYATLYLNGQKANGEQLAAPRGFVVPPSTARFRLGKPSQFQDPPEFYLDEVMLFEKALTQAEVLSIYNTGIFGPSYVTTLFGGDPDSEGSPYTLSANEYSELTNELDITSYVESYRIDRDLRQVIDTATLSIYQTWGMSNILDSLRANTYVTVEERYVNNEASIATDWYQLGAFLVDGPMGESTTEDNRVFNINLKGLLKLTSFDLCHHIIEPDRLLVKKRTFDIVTSFTDYVQYQLSHDVIPGAVYDNWADYPAPKLWVTDFLNLGVASEGGITNATDEIRIKGSEGAVKVHAGEGSVIINKNYLQDPVTENGLSNPQTVKGEIYRFATANDIEKDVVISAITYSSRWLVAFHSEANCDNKTLWVKSGNAKGKYYKIQTYNDTDYHLVDPNGLAVSPLDEGLAVGDLVQLGDFNSVEDALRKVLLKNGYQENDSTLPFYFVIDPCPNQLAPSVPPHNYDITDDVRWLAVIEDILTYAPPDYRVYTDNEGVIRASLVGVATNAVTAHEVTGKIDLNEDKSDYGITTKLVVEGEGGQSTNVALAIAYGGFAAVRAYALTGYATNYEDLTGTTLTQAAANTLVSQCFSNNPKIPIPTGTGWNYGNPSINRHYGVLFQKFGTPTDVKRWNFEDLDVCAVDLGRTDTGSSILIDSVEVTWFDHFVEGNRIKQSMFVYYMTEDDYQNEVGTAAPSAPNDADTNYFPSATAKSWKLLVDEFSLEEGANNLPYTEFVHQKPLKARFLKFRVGQCQHRLKMQSGQYKDKVVSRVGIAEIKVYNSLIIRATAELGVTPPLNTGDYKDLASRVRRRTDFIPKATFIQDFNTGKDFAITQLQERYIDFTPVSVSVFGPTIEAGQAITLKHPETKVTRKYLVTASTRIYDGTSQLQLLNYDLVI